MRCAAARNEKNAAEGSKWILPGVSSIAWCSKLKTLFWCRSLAEWWLLLRVGKPFSNLVLSNKGLVRKWARVIFFLNMAGKLVDSAVVGLFCRGVADVFLMLLVIFGILVGLFFEILFVIFFYILFGIFFDILFDVFCNILFNILLDILFNILFGIYFGILSGG